MKNKKVTKYKPKEIIRYNKLIAKFMGEKFFTEKTRNVFDLVMDTERKVKFKTMLVGSDWAKYSNAHNQNELCYHLHYDWIMPVVDKIQEIGAYMDIRPRHSHLVWWYSPKRTVTFSRGAGGGGGGTEPRKPFDSIGGKFYSRDVGVGETAEKVNCETKIEAVYNNVVYFIEWYNKNVKKKK